MSGQVNPMDNLFVKTASEGGKRRERQAERTVHHGHGEAGGTGLRALLQPPPPQVNCHVPTGLLWVVEDQRITGNQDCQHDLHTQGFGTHYPTIQKRPDQRGSRRAHRQNGYPILSGAQYCPVDRGFHPKNHPGSSA